MPRAHSPKPVSRTTSLCCGTAGVEVVPRCSLTEGTSQDRSSSGTDGLFQTASLTQRPWRCMGHPDQPGSSSPAALPSPAGASCPHFQMLAKEEESKVEDPHLPFEGMAQKLCRSLLLASHWPAFNHVTTRVIRKDGGCSLHMDGPVPTPGFCC